MNAFSSLMVCLIRFAPPNYVNARTYKYSDRLFSILDKVLLPLNGLTKAVQA